MPAQTQVREFHVYFEQTYIRRCLPRAAIWTAGVIGLVRVDT